MFYNTGKYDCLIVADTKNYSVTKYGVIVDIEPTYLRLAF